MKTSTRRLLTFAAACILAPASGQAEEDNEETRTAFRRAPEADANVLRSRSVLEEVVVSAQRRQENLQDVPISISVLSGQELDKSTAQGISEILSRVPGVVTSLNAQTGNTLLAIRGVTAPTAFNAGSSPIGYYLDSVPFGFVRMASVPDPDIYDLKRIEVLRGPQGTLYGAGSQNGVVRVLTNDANLDDFEIKARTILSRTDSGGDNVRADAAMNVPLVEGKLAARAVLGYKDLSGWIDRPGNIDANDTRVRNGRIKLDAQPSEQFSTVLSAWVSRSDSRAPAVSADNRQYPLADEPLVQDFDIYDLKLNYDFSSFSITNTSSYIDFLSDGDLDLAIVGLGWVNKTRLESRVFSDELSIRSLHDGRWRWTLGGMFRDGQEHLFQVRSVGLTAPQSIEFDSTSWAAFGELTRIFLNGKVELTAGLRYFEDDVAMREKSRVVAVQPAQYISSDRKFHATTPRLTLTWYAQEQMTIYASYAEGFRSGFDQLPSVLLVAPSLRPVEPDLLKNYELGTKGSLWDKRLNYDAAVYYMDWEDVQLPLVVIVDGVGRSAAVNGPSSSGIGAEFALTTTPAKGLVLGVNFSWNDLQVDADVASGSAVLFNKGDRLNMSAEYTVGASADYTFPLGRNGLAGTISASTNLTSSLNNVGLVGTTKINNEGDRIGVSRASFSIASPHRWTASLFVDNLSNEEGAVTHGILLPQQDTRIRPRTYGLQLEYRL